MRRPWVQSPSAAPGPLFDRPCAGNRPAKAPAAVAHDGATADEDRVDVGTGGGEHQVRGENVLRRDVRAIEIDQDDVRELAFSRWRQSRLATARQCHHRKRGPRRPCVPEVTRVEIRATADSINATSPASRSSTGAIERIERTRSARSEERIARNTERPVRCPLRGIS